MCGILALYKVHDVYAEKDKAIQYLRRQRHRGPDWSGRYVSVDGKSDAEALVPPLRAALPSPAATGTILVHERLAIVGLTGGSQPIRSHDGRYALAVNGEIYNHIQLREQFNGYRFQTFSDCEPIIPLYEKYGIDAPKYLDGMFAWTLYDKEEDVIVAARDPIGITTLYMGKSLKLPETRYFASELKCLIDECDDIVAFPPGHVYTSKTDQITRYFEPSWWDGLKVPTEHVDYAKVRETLELAVRKRLMAEVPYGVLLSGGLDSSLIASIAARETAKANEKALKEKQGIVANTALTGVDDKGLLHSLGFNSLHSFAIGLPNAPDLIAAEKVAEFIGTVHHSHTFTLEEGLDALNEVIWHLETFDVTTIRALTPMYLLLRKIKAQGVKMVLSGEGSDEVFGGYLYFANAPSPKEFHEECVKRVKNLHYADCLRANKSTMAWGLEARVPFLDKKFLEVCMNINPEDKMIDNEHIEKYILRKAFDVEEGEKPYLPKEILWRQKEQFSDGVGYSWIDGLKDAAEAAVSDEEFANPKPEWGDDIPQTKEAYWYRCKFDDMFKPLKAAALTVMRWIPKAEWGCHADPSGRYAKTHEHKVNDTK